MSEQSIRYDLSMTSRVVADDLRAAERSIEIAQRDLLTFMLTATDANRARGYSPALAQPVMKSATAALSALVEGQGHLSNQAHGAAEKLARRLGLTEIDYGGVDGKPNAAEVFTGASASPEQTVEA